jgi:alcohol dehydrogenase class IV
LFGPGTINEAGEKFKEFECKKILVVVDKTGVKLGLSERMQTILKKSDIESAVYDGVLPDPPAATIDEGAAFAKKEKIDGILAVGGGSVIDTAKGINILMTNPGTIEKYLVSGMVAPKTKPGLPLICAPTTAGTGSEASGGAVVTSKSGVKMAVFTGAALGIIDAELAVSLPPNVTAGCGMDAFAHAAESITNLYDSEYGKLMASDTIRRVMKYLPTAVQDGKNIEARSHMGYAASTSIIGGSQTGCNQSHSCAHTLGTTFHLPHGDMCGICLPVITKMNAKVVPEKVRFLGEAMGLTISGGASSEEIGDAVSAALTDFLRKIGIQSLKAHGVRREDLVSRRDLSDMMMKDLCFGTAPTRDYPIESYDDLWVKFYDNYE